MKFLLIILNIQEPRPLRYHQELYLICFIVAAIAVKIAMETLVDIQYSQ